MEVFHESQVVLDKSKEKKDTSEDLLVELLLVFLY